MEIRPVGAE